MLKLEQIRTKSNDISELDKFLNQIYIHFFFFKIMKYSG